MTTDIRLNERIYDGVRFRVSRGWDEEANRPVILKQLRAVHPSAAEVARLARELSITRYAANDAVAAAHALVEQQGVVTLVLEDFGGRGLSGVWDQPLSLTEVLDIACQITSGLATIHRRDIVHRNISPSNIVYNRETGVAKLIDFGIAQVVGRTVAPARPAAEFVGNMHYASPEQTGRMNRAIDYRSDFYSLGATLYRLISRQRPFEATTPLGLFHAHLAKTAVPLHQLDPEIPERVSAIVATLLEKRAEDRYQSASGLLHDLERCREALRLSREIEPFELRGQDIDERLHIPEKLYGRTDEIAALMRSFEEAATGTAGVLLVAGYSGIGKTSFVHEVLRALTGLSAAFVSGKLDQFDRAAPYASVLQALRSRVLAILTEEAEALERWKHRILDHVGETGASVLVEVIPELEHILGPQPAAGALMPAEARNRFQTVIERFVRSLASADHPLVIFLDDLQWADLASIELVTRLATDPEQRHVLFIGAYRDNEVDHAHPLTSAIEEMRRSGARLEHIELGPLGRADARALVSDTVAGAANSNALADLCHAKTRGNAFYLKSFIESLHAEGHLRFDTVNRVWTWDLRAIEALPVSDNVVDFLSRRMREAPRDVQRALGLAACTGDAFDLNTLACALELSRNETLEAIRGPLKDRLLQPLSDSFWYGDPSDEKAKDGENFELSFVHDRIRQSARALVDDDDAALAHLRVGRYLLGRCEGAEAGHPVPFDVIAHLNHGSSLVEDTRERAHIRDLNVQAARRAAGSAAFGAAHRFYRQAVDLLEDAPWSEGGYETTLAMHVEGARAAYLSGDDEAMEALLTAALGHARTPLDRAAVQEVRINSLASKQQLVESLRLALGVLADLGVELQLEPSPKDIEAIVGETLGMVQGSGGAAGILARGRADDPTAIVAQRIQNNIMASAYLAAPALLPMLACTIVRSTLRHGVCRESPYGFAVFALVLAIGNIIDVAYEVGCIARELLDAVDDRAIMPRTLHVLGAMVDPQVTPLRDSIEKERRVFELGMDTGDLEYAGWGLHMEIANGFFAGLELTSFAPVIGGNIEVLERHGLGQSLACSTPFAQTVRNLSEKVADPARLVGPEYDEAAHLDDLLAIKFRGAAFVVTNLGTFVRFVFRDLEAAVSFADAGGQYADGVPATYHVPWWHQFRTLAILGQVGADDSEETRTAALASVEASLEYLKMLRGFSLANHAHRVHLLDAEVARIEGRIPDALRSFDASIAAARAEGFLHEEALANELAGRFFVTLGSAAAATAYLREACSAWVRWGATAKATHLADEFAQLLGTATMHANGASLGRSVMPASAGSLEADLDSAALLEAAGLIAAELRPETLSTRILDVAIEIAGATRGHLLIEHDGAFFIDAAADVDGVPLTSPGTPVGESGDVPRDLIAYVARTGEALVLADARADARWKTDRWENRPTSVLCAPISYQGTSSGIIYLENGLSSGAFTPGRIRLLQHIAAQAAISIENVRQTEALRQQRDQLEAALDASRAKGFFVANMSHELRTPLNAIIGYSEMLLEEAEDLEAESVGDLSRIVNAGHHLRGVINDILDLSKIEAGKTELSPTTVEMGTLLETVQDTVEPLVAKGGNTLVVSHDPTSVGAVVVDATKLRQILVNLLSNAAKFTENGTIELSVTMTSGHDEGGQATLAFAVKDTGIGMTPDQLQRVLEPFTQAEGDTDEKYGGTGLGLTITARLCELMGGSLEVESSPGVGTTCTAIIRGRVVA